MTQIRKRQPKLNSSYNQLFGDERISSLMQQIHIAMIRHGHDLESLLWRLIPSEIQATIDDVLRAQSDGLMIVYHPESPKSGTKEGIKSDFAFFWLAKKRFLVVELKAGIEFDTGKASETRANLQSLAEYLTQRTGFAGKYAVCGFSALVRQQVVDGFKQRFTVDQVMTGFEFCGLARIDYEEVLTVLKVHQHDNREYFIDRAAAIIADVPVEQYFHQVRGLQDNQMTLGL